jgi:hypothetical protein
MKHYILTERKEYDRNNFSNNIFEDLENAFPPRTEGVYIFRPYHVEIIGTKRIIQTQAKEVQEFLEKRINREN